MWYVYSIFEYTQIARFNEANMGPTWVLSAPGRPHVGPMNLAIRVLPIWDIILTLSLDICIIGWCYETSSNIWSMQSPVYLTRRCRIMFPTSCNVAYQLLSYDLKFPCIPLFLLITNICIPYHIFIVTFSNKMKWYKNIMYNGKLCVTDLNIALV